MSLAKLADRIGRYVCIQAGLESETGKISYGVECALVLFLSLAVVLTAGCLVGVPSETAIVAGTILIMKYIIGGPHLSGFIRCVAYSALYIVGTALILKLIQNLRFSTWFLTTVLFGGVSVVVFFVPLVREGIALSKGQLKKRKILASLFLILATAMNCFTMDYKWRSVLFGIILSLINVTPFGVGWVNFLEGVTRRKGGELT